MRYAIGIDLGGTNIAAGVVSEDYRLLAKESVPTHAERPWQAIVADMAALTQGLIRSSGLDPADCVGIGVGNPGVCRGDTGEVVYANNLNWEHVPLGTEITRLTGYPCRIGNDANCAALGEAWKGGGAGSRSSLFVTLGTGVGGGVILNGKILGGAHGVGGEIGHITVSAPDKYPCTCGKRGCVEQYASATGIVRVTTECLAACDAPSVLREKAETLTCKDVFDAAKAGDALAVETLEQVFDYLGEALASACCVCDPERIILGGGVTKAGEYLLHGAARHFEAHMFHACKGTQFSLATLGNDAGMYGAYRQLA